MADIPGVAGSVEIPASSSLTFYVVADDGA